MFQQSFK